MTEALKTTVNITVDGVSIECEPGELVIEAAKRSGIYVPHFCWHPRMDPIGACRMCLVHIQGGPPKPQTSCTTPVAEGMVVQTQFTNPEIREAQQGILEFLLINHPLDCPICDRGGECPLQDQAQDYGPDDSRFLEAKRRFKKPIPISPAVNLDRERCIMCFRCTRFCDELSGDRAIAAMERGAGSYIYPFEDSEFDSYFSGNTIEICPVGALTASEYRFKARPWDLNLTQSVCTLCASGCNVSYGVRVADGALVRTSQFTNEDVNEEWLCDKGRFGHAYVSSPQRISTPWVRDENGLHEATWDEAISAICHRLGPILERADPDSVAMFAGPALCNEDAHAASKFARLVLRTNSVASDFYEFDPLLDATVTYDEALSASRLVLVGLDAREELPMLFLRARIAHFKRGLEIVNVHPRRVADFGEWISVTPGDYGSIPAEVFLDANTVVAVGDAVVRQPGAAEVWGGAEAAGARFSWGFRSAGRLGALRAGLDSRLIPTGAAAQDSQVRTGVERIFGSALPTHEGLGAAQILERAAAGSIQVLFIAGIDLFDAPGTDTGALALQGAKFVVLNTILSEAQLNFADVILPAVATAERDGTTTNFEGRTQTLRRAGAPPGSAMPDHQIFDEIARRLGRPINLGTTAAVQAEMQALADLGKPLRVEPRSESNADTSAGDLTLISYPLLYDAGSRIGMTESIRKMTPDAFVELNPASAQGITHGSKVIVSSAHGSIVAELRVTDDIKVGAVFVPASQPGAEGRRLQAGNDPSPTVSIELA